MTTSTTLVGRWEQRLRSAVKGRVIGPGSAGYDEARKVYLTGFDRRPRAIVRPTSAEEVARVVTLAREGDVELAIRSGGHSFGGHGVCEGGWVLDLSAMRALDIDPAERTAWAEMGLTAGDYTFAAGEYGLATPFGDTPTVGLGGLTLGGGVGYLHRMLGLTIDNVLAAEVVTADGRILHTDADSHPDLFWAVRGGGGNFGVVTRFRYRLHEVTDVVGGMLLLPADPETIVAFADAAMSAPEEMSGVAAVMKAPPMPFIPPELVGKPVIFAMLVHVGSPAAGERAFAPIRAVAKPLFDTLAPLRYPELFAHHDGPKHVAIAMRSSYRDTLDRAAAEIILDRALSSDAIMAMAQFRVLGGAVARVPAEATAFAHRRRGMLVNFAASYADPARAAEYEGWVDDFAADLRQGEPGAFPSFLSPGEGRERDAYPAPTRDRLLDVKRRYDPENLFRLNLNVAG
jgi:FAD/FMN-containing dehydrogenase